MEETRVSGIENRNEIKNNEVKAKKRIRGRFRKRKPSTKEKLNDGKRKRKR